LALRRFLPPLVYREMLWVSSFIAMILSAILSFPRTSELCALTGAPTQNARQQARY